jgi:sensor histidine kinase YesM
LDAKKNYQEALHVYHQHVSLKDSLFNLEKAKQVSELQVRYESEQREKELLAKTKAIEILQLTKRLDDRIKMALVVVSILLVGLAFLLFNRYQLKKRSERETAEKNQAIAIKNCEIESINKELEKRMLRAQMDPHFIFNSLNSIQHFITINDKRSTLKYINKFSKLIRQVLDSSVSTMVTLEDEIQLLKNYIELEALRLNNKFEYHFTIDHTLDLSFVEVPFLLLQPYVENAIQHGLRAKEQGGWLHIRLTDNDNFIHCEIEDNGVGRVASNASRMEHHKSHGMSVTNQRLQRLNQNYATNTRATIEDLYDETFQAVGTKVTLTIPKQYEQSNFAFAATSHHYSG